MTIDIVDRLPDAGVLTEEYTRLLGYPPHRTLEGRALELADAAREWYLANGRPWVEAREVRTGVDADAVVIGEHRFRAGRLRHLVSEADATTMVVAAVSAGAEAERQAQILWEAGKPDEYFFLEMYASAVVEHLVMTTGGRLCASGDARDLAVLPHDSPGYAEWDVSEQAALLAVLRGDDDRRAQPLEVLSSGMLRPKKSLLAAFGLTRHIDRVKRLTGLSPCEACALPRCTYRRRPFARARRVAADGVEAPPTADGSSPAPIATDAHYTVNRKALARWAAERLTIARRADGTTDVTFRYEGTTCMNMGRPITFRYDLTLGPPGDGYPIRRLSAAPATDDTGHRFMCRYVSHGEALMAAITAEQPLLGHPIDAILTWARPHATAGCYCDLEARLHKWGLVFETVHFALARDHAQHAGKDRHP